MSRSANELRWLRWVNFRQPPPGAGAPGRPRPDHKSLGSQIVLDLGPISGLESGTLIFRVLVELLTNFPKFHEVPHESRVDQAGGLGCDYRQYSYHDRGFHVGRLDD